MRIRLHPGRRVTRVALAILHAVAVSALMATLQLPMAHAVRAAPLPAHCNGAALSGGAQLLCSLAQDISATQICTYSWALVTLDNQTSVVSGSFVLARGTVNQQVYRGSGFDHAASGPIIMCQALSR